jgi:hypothetical protein
MALLKAQTRFIGVKTRNQKYEFIVTVNRKPRSSSVMSKVVSFSIPNESCILQVSIAVQKNRDTQQQHQQPHHQPQSYGRVQQQQWRQYRLVQQHL